MLHPQAIAAGSYDPAQPHVIQSFIPREGEHYALPGDVTKAGAIGVHTTALRLQGARAPVIAYWRHIADTTDRAAWHDSARAPINWRRQCDIAREMGISGRQARRYEAELEGFGVLARLTAANGYRGRRSGQRYGAMPSAGLSLEPALANYAAFALLVEMAAEVEEARQGLIWDIRIAERRARVLTGGIADIESRHWAVAALAGARDLHRPEELREAGTEALTAWHMAILDIEDRVRDALAPFPTEDEAPNGHAGTAAAAEDQPPAPAAARVPASGSAAGTRAPGQSPEDQAPSSVPDASPVRPVSSQPDHTPHAVPGNGLSTAPDSANQELAEKQQKMSAAPDMGDRCHIQPEINLNDSCNAQDYAGASKRTPAKAGDGFTGASPPDGGDAGFGKKSGGARVHVNPRILEKLTQEALRALASDEAALYLDALEDWRDAIPFLLRELGINVSAWLEACDVMGDGMAFLSLLVIDRNRFHPVTPVRNPGGALRAFTRRARHGQLDLGRAVLGIWERERQGRQPKGAKSGARRQV